MWSEEEFLAKTSLYFRRAAQHPDSDDEYALWLLLGLEFLLRAPLAGQHAALLAAPEGNSLLSACGVDYPNADPKSVPMRTVVERVRHVVIGLEGELVGDAHFLTNLRNAELHTSRAALASLPTEEWLPRFYRLVERLSGYYGVTVDEVLTEELANHARLFAQEADNRLTSEVHQRIADARRFVEGLTADEIEARRGVLTFSSLRTKAVPCPACGNDSYVGHVLGRILSERIDEDGDIHQVRLYVAVTLACQVCGLELESTSELRVAGVPLEFEDETVESIGERYEAEQMYMDYDYGND